MRRLYEHVFSWLADVEFVNDLVSFLLARGLEVLGILVIRVVEG
jgi:hypothetical protein